MITVEDVYKFIDSVAPFSTAMGFDNCGLLVGDLKKEVKKVMLTLDVTTKVVEEAKEKNIDLIISHHPVIFKPLKQLYAGSVPYLLASCGISVICAHTNLDMSKGGVNECLASRLRLKNISPLSVYKEINYNKIVVFAPKEYENDIIESMSEQGAGVLGEYFKCSFTSDGTGKFFCGSKSNPFAGNAGNYESVKEVRIEMICPKNKVQQAINAMLKVHPYEEPAYDVFESEAVKDVIPLGFVGDLENPMSSREFARYVKELLNCEGVRYTDSCKEIKRVGLCSGAGDDMVPNAINLNLDAFVTGEIKHSRILELNENNITLVDAGHFKTEDVYKDSMAKMLENKFKGIEVIKSLTCSDKIKYI